MLKSWIQHRMTFQPATRLIGWVIGYRLARRAGYIQPQVIWQCIVYTVYNIYYRGSQGIIKPVIQHRPLAHPPILVLSTIHQGKLFIMEFGNFLVFILTWKATAHWPVSKSQSVSLLLSSCFTTASKRTSYCLCIPRRQGKCSCTRLCRHISLSRRFTKPTNGLLSKRSMILYPTTKWLLDTQSAGLLVCGRPPLVLASLGHKA